MPPQRLVRLHVTPEACREMLLCAAGVEVTSGVQCQLPKITHLYFEAFRELHLDHIDATGGSIWKLYLNGVGGWLAEECGNRKLYSLVVSQPLSDDAKVLIARGRIGRSNVFTKY